MRKYAPVWNQLKTKGAVEFTVSNEGARRILNGIKLEKTTENVARRKAGLVGWSKLIIEQEAISATMLRVKLRFDFASAL